MDKTNMQIAAGKGIINSYKIINEYSRMFVPFNVLMIVVQGVIPIVTIMVMQTIINMIQTGKNDFYSVLGVIVIYVILNAVNEIILALHSYYNGKITLGFSKHVNIKMLNKASELKLKDFEMSETYNTINRAQTQDGGSIIAYVSSVLEVLKQFIVICSSAVVLMKIHWWIITITLVVPIIKCILTIHLDTKWYKLRIERTQKERRKWYINFLFMTGQAFKELKILGVKKYLIDQYEKIQNSIILQDKKMYRKQFELTIGLSMVDWIATGASFTYVVLQGFMRRILIGDVTAYVGCIENIKTSVQGIFSGIENIVNQSLYVNLLFDFFEIEEEKIEKRIWSEKIRKIELKNVSFQYKKGEYALKNINLIINSNSRIAFVGRNGSGKTTLVKLILGLYDSYEGEIYVNDINLKTIDISSYQKKIGCVFQDYIKYETSVRENVAFGDITKINDDNIIQEAIKKVHLKTQILQTNGLDTIIGNWFGEQELSVGEWQRVAIARTLIKDADMYIFDEPDASLDILKQKELVSVYKEMLEERIGIYISHKINFVRLICSNVCVLENGEIVQQGKEEELRKKEGIYKELYLQCKVE